MRPVFRCFDTNLFGNPYTSAVAFSILDSIFADIFIIVENSLPAINEAESRRLRISLIRRTIGEIFLKKPLCIEDMESLRLCLSFIYCILRDADSSYRLYGESPCGESQLAIWVDSLIS
jgi:hypothetical protein